MSFFILITVCFVIALILFFLHWSWGHDGTEGDFISFGIHCYPAIVLIGTGIIFSIIAIFTNTFWLQIVLIVILGMCVAWPVFLYLFFFGDYLKDVCSEDMQVLKSLFKSKKSFKK